MADSEPLDPVTRFGRVARDAPDRIAVRAGADEQTFAELDRDSAALAGELAALGVGVGDRVGVSLARGVRLVTALLAVWRAGAAYVPLDPQYPRSRLEFMAADSDIKVLISSGESDLRPPGVAVLDALPTGSASSAAFSAAPAVAAMSAATAASDRPVPPPLAPAYVIYTSGSTGRPKGVELTRGGVAWLLSALEAAGAYATEPRVVGWNASVSFDASVQQWARVCRGDTITVIGEPERTDAAKLGELLDTHGVEDFDLTPSHWDLLRSSLLTPRADGRKLRLFMGGEPVPERVWREIAEGGTSAGIEALNLYGPTECTVDATTTWISGDGPHIGRPLPGVRVQVLGAGLQPVSAPGEVGELFLAGPGLALGYVGGPAQTAQRFVADPFTPGGGRIYRTGDLVRLRDDGVLEFAGRADRQVKIRGYRVELGEVEAVVSAHPAVAASVLTVHRDAALGDRMAAYYVASEPVSENGLRDHCAAVLPDFMIPGVFTAIDAIPLTVNGKVDWDRLPEPHTDRDDQLVAPQGFFEELIAEVWSEVLGRDQVSAEDDFFALGGHSLVALSVVARLKKEVGLAIRTSEVYRHPRLRDLASHIEAAHAQAAQTAMSSAG